jgi:hypothetical protein
MTRNGAYLGMSHADAKAKLWGTPIPEHLTHYRGSLACKIYGCDCKLCLPSGRRNWQNRGESGPIPGNERQARLVASKKGQPVPPGTKHGLYCKKVYDCPCKLGRTAALAQGRKYQARRRERDRGRPPGDPYGHWTTGYSGGIDADIIWWPKKGQPASDCPLDNCTHPSHD